MIPLVDTLCSSINGIFLHYIVLQITAFFSANWFVFFHWHVNTMETGPFEAWVSYGFSSSQLWWLTTSPQYGNISSTLMDYSFRNWWWDERKRRVQQLLNNTATHVIIWTVLLVYTMSSVKQTQNKPCCRRQTAWEQHRSLIAFDLGYLRI